MNQIPKIIHQIWSNPPLSNVSKMLSDTWRRDYPDWDYVFWDAKSIDDFIFQHFPEYSDIFYRFPYNVQRWDAIRYLILYKIGGMYVDFDYESIKPFEDLIIGKSCCFAMEPQSHCDSFWKHVPCVFNNALMLSIPSHFFIGKIVQEIFSDKTLTYIAPKDICVLNTTGPWKLIDIYYELSDKEKEQIYLIPSEYVTPFDVPQANRFRMGEMSNELEDCLESAYAVHYFFSSWRKNNK